jgi:uncharacterized protein
MKILQKICFILLLTTFSSVYAGSCWDDADFDVCLKKAEEGNKGAQYTLGVMYYFGKGVPQDYKEAVKWYRLAAEQGYAHAQFNLGLMYSQGEGGAEDYKEAVKWFRKAAEQGIPKAQGSLGVMYYFGMGIKKNTNEARKWWRRAAEQGDKLSEQALRGEF